METNTFALIIGIFSFLVLLFLLIFIVWWLFSRWAEYSRFRRILMSQRDVAASYNVIKRDAKKALDALAGNVDEARANEAKFLIGRINDNLEKMNNYVAKGVSLIGKYDIIKKYNKDIKL